MRHLQRITTVTDPETGKVYPMIAGGSGEPPAPAPADSALAPADPPPATPPADPAPTPPEPSPDDPKPPWGSDEEFDPEKAWKLIQNLRGDIEELKPKAARLKELEDADKTEAQKAADRAAAAEQRADAAEVRAAKLEAAVKHGLSQEDLELLGTGTAEEIEERAEKLAARLNASGGETPPPSSRRQGRGGTPIKPSGKDKGKEEARRRYGDPKNDS